MELDDDWGGSRRFRDPDSQLPHRCTSTPRSYSFFRPSQAEYLNFLLEMNKNYEWLCEEHKVPLESWHCPVSGCKEISRIKRSYYEELKKLKDGSLEN